MSGVLKEGKVFDLKQAEDQIERHARNIQHTSSKNYEDLGDRVERTESGTQLGLIYLRQQTQNESGSLQQGKWGPKETPFYDKKMTQTLGADHGSFKNKGTFIRKPKLSTKFDTNNTPQAVTD